MPRKPRIDLPGYHHIINRGLNRENVFLCDEDKVKFLQILEKTKEIYKFTVHSYCVLDNHYHLLIETHQNNLSLAIRYINSQYAIYFNRKMQRIGPLWQGRFKSWYVHEDKYLWLLLRYIEMNPVKISLSERVGEYEFSSSYVAFRSLEKTILQSSLLFEKDIRDWLAPLMEKDLTALTGFEAIKFEKKGDGYTPNKNMPIADYFSSSDVIRTRNISIYKAFMDGYQQGEIARYLNLSSVAISRIVSNERLKRDLFAKIKDRGLFWSYSAEIGYDEDKSELLIETVLKYSDLEDIKLILSLFGKRKVKRVWDARLVNDSRFKKLNYFLARVLFKLDVEADDFDEVKYSRAEKLRLLAG